MQPVTALRSAHFDHLQRATFDFDFDRIRLSETFLFKQVEQARPVYSSQRIISVSRISHNVPKTIPDVETLLLSAVHKSDQLRAEVQTHSNVWDDAEFQELLSLRRACSNEQ